MENRGNMKKILVRNAKTKHFLDELNGWTAELARARNFPSSLNAILHCVRMEINNIQLNVYDDVPGVLDLAVTIENDHLRIASDFARRCRHER
jgi:hypothetical protein